MDMLQELCEIFINKISTYTPERLGIAECIERSLEDAKQFILEYFAMDIEALDESLAADSSLRSDWVIHRKSTRSLETIAGTLSYTRRYYRHRETGDYSHLIDVLCGIEKGERIEKGLRAKICNLVSKHSYAETVKLACENHLSKQSVKRITSEVRLPERSAYIAETGPVLHIQADEDHVVTQDSRRSSELRLAVIHTGVKKENGKNHLENKQYFIGRGLNESSAAFRERVNETLLEQYIDKIWPEIYIHGDGASWIKSGLSWLPKSHFVLDKFHAFQYLKKIAPPDSEDYHYLKSCMLSNRKKDFSEHSEEVAGKYGYQIEEALRARQYILNNWSGISIWTRDEKSGSSCAEGLVSHCFKRALFDGAHGMDG